MAEQPKQSGVKVPEQVDPMAGNRFLRIFMAPIIKLVTKESKVYGKKGETKTQKLANVTLELASVGTDGKPAGSGIFLRGQIRAEQAPKAKKAKPVFAFFANAQIRQSCIIAEGPKAEADLEAYRRHVAQQFALYMKEHANDLPTATDSDVEDIDIDLSGMGEDE